MGKTQNLENIDGKQSKVQTYFLIGPNKVNKQKHGKTTQKHFKKSLKNLTSELVSKKRVQKQKTFKNHTNTFQSQLSLLNWSQRPERPKWYSAGRGCVGETERGGVSRGWGGEREPERWELEGWARTEKNGRAQWVGAQGCGAPNLALVFPSLRSIFALFFSLKCLLVELRPRFKAAARPKCVFELLWMSPQRPPGFHKMTLTKRTFGLSVVATPPATIQREDVRERKKNEQV